MKMPGMNGIEFIKKAKAKYPDKKFYILTGFEITEQIKEALDKGIILEYFCKPFEIEKMHRIIADVLNK
jgi:YesN/AraC family two-component response regulator